MIFRLQVALNLYGELEDSEKRQLMPDSEVRVNRVVSNLKFNNDSLSVHLFIHSNFN